MAPPLVGSDILYPKDSSSPHSGVPAEVLCRGRDFVVSAWAFWPSLSRAGITEVGARAVRGFQGLSSGRWERAGVALDPISPSTRNPGVLGFIEPLSSSGLGIQTRGP